MRLIDADEIEYYSDETGNEIAYKVDTDQLPTITPPGWVSVKDRLPNFGKLVIATEGTTYGIAWYCSDCTWMIKMGYKSESWIGRKVTHWMPLPEPPKED